MACRHVQMFIHLFKHEKKHSQLVGILFFYYLPLSVSNLNFNHKMNTIFRTALLLLFLLAYPISAWSSLSDTESTSKLPRGKATPQMRTAFNQYIDAARLAGQDIHSVMIVQNGQVYYEKWMGEGEENKPHILNSISKTFTSTAVGLAIAEGKLKLTDKIISFFPDKCPAKIPQYLADVTIKDLLTMSCGHETDPTNTIRNSEDTDWIKQFFNYPIKHKPGTYFTYNSLGTYLLSAICQKVTGEKIVDFLRPRLFEPLGITNVHWEESPQGINCGGWGLYLKTEDLAKMGLLLLQKGKWNGEQIVPSKWIEEASTKQVESRPAGVTPAMLMMFKMTPENSDWLQGYGYQMWRCRNNAFRADGANGQFILVFPEKNAVIVVTAHLQDMQAELNLIWNYLYPVLQ